MRFGFGFGPGSFVPPAVVAAAAEPPIDPLTLFEPTSQGCFFDFQDLSTMFVQETGQTPASVGDPVGLILDKSKGLVATERSGDPDLLNPSNYTTAGETGTTIEVGRATLVEAIPSAGDLRMSAAMANALPSNVFCRVTVVIENYTSGNLRVRLKQGQQVAIPLSGDGTYVLWARTGSTTNGLTQISGQNSAASLSCDIVKWSVEEVAGNHLYQGTASARPTLQQGDDGTYYLYYDGLDDVLQGHVPFNFDSVSFLTTTLYRELEVSALRFVGAIQGTVNGHYLTASASSSRIFAVARDGTEAVTAGAEVGASPILTKIVHDSQLIGTTQLDLYNNGVPQTGGTGPRTAPLSVSDALLKLGDAAYNGRIYSFMMIDKDVNEYRAQIRRFFASQAGIGL